MTGSTHVLGASTSVAGGVAVLPFTHGTPLSILAIAAITIGSAVLLSQLVSRAIKNL